MVFCLPDRYLDCPIIAIYGSEDTLTPKRFALSWADYTSKKLEIKTLQGAGHLFPIQDEALPDLNRFLREALVR